MPELSKTLTLDNGFQVAGHRHIISPLGAEGYCARPYRSWERGANESTNGLVRRSVPKRASIKTIRQEDAQAYSGLLNGRSRKNLPHPQRGNNAGAEKARSCTPYVQLRRTFAEFWQLTTRRGPDSPSSRQWAYAPSPLRRWQRAAAPARQVSGAPTRQ